MADGPTFVETGGRGGTIVAVVVAIAAAVLLLLLFGVIGFEGNGGRDIEVKGDAPAIQTPADPAPAAPQPTTGGG